MSGLSFVESTPLIVRTTLPVFLWVIFHIISVKLVAAVFTISWVSFLIILRIDSMRFESDILERTNTLKEESMHSGFSLSFFIFGIGSKRFELDILEPTNTLKEEPRHSVISSFLLDVKYYPPTCRPM